MINKLFFLATNHSACINFCPQSVSQSAMQVVSQSASQSGSQSISQSVSQSVSQQINDFGQKLQISLLFVLGKKQALKQCLTIIQLEKKSSQTIKFGILQSCHAEIFSQRLTHDFGQKLQISFSFAFFGEISLEIKSDDHLVKNQALSQSTVLAI